MKYNIVIGNLQEQYMRRVEDIVLNPPATGRYELLKKEFIKRMAVYSHKQGTRRKKHSVNWVLPSHPSRLTPQIGDPYKNLDTARKWKLFEREQMGDRTPSQFYEAMKSLAIPSTPDDFLLAAWKIRLPMYMQQILAVGNETDPNVVTKIADRIYEVTAQVARIAAASKPRY